MNSLRLKSSTTEHDARNNMANKNFITSGGLHFIHVSRLPFDVSSLHLSKITLAPWPTPTHMVASPYLLFLLFISCTSVVESRTPLQPKGCPSAIAPPFTFTRS